MAFDESGNLYGVCAVGTSTGGGALWEVTAAGAYKDLHNFGPKLPNGKADIFFGISGVTIDPAGNLYGTTESGGIYNPQGNKSAGGVWEMTAEGKYNVLHYFGGTVKNAGGTNGMDGFNPYAGVTVDALGNLYGTTEWGGPIKNTAGQGCGVLWEVTKAGVYKDLHDFGASALATDGLQDTDGYQPCGAVVLDNAGNIYGTTREGGENDLGIFWELATNTVKAVTPSIYLLPGGTPCTATVTIDAPAPVGGLPAYLKSYSNDVIVPASITIPAGKTSTTFVLDSKAVQTSEFANVSARIGGVMVWGLLDVQPPALKSIRFDPGAVTGGTSTVGTVSIATLAPVGGLTVTLDNLTVAALPPFTVTIPAGKVFATFPVTTLAVAVETAAGITATSNGASVAGSLTVYPPALESLTLNLATVAGGGTVTGKVVIGSPAPKTGLVIAVSSSSSAATAPATVTIPSGATSAPFTVSTTAVKSKTKVTITVLSNAVKKAAALTVTP